MGFREFIKQLEQEGQLTRIKKEVSTDLEMAGIIDALGEKPCYFENVKESSLSVIFLTSGPKFDISEMPPALSTMGP